MTIHIRVDAWYDESSDEINNGRIACGITDLPSGDSVVYEADSYAYNVADCQVCNPGGPRAYGTPISRLSGRPGSDGFDAFSDIAATWGYP